MSAFRHSRLQKWVSLETWVFFVLALCLAAPQDYSAAAQDPNHLAPPTETDVLEILERMFWEKERKVSARDAALQERRSETIPQTIRTDAPSDPRKVRLIRQVHRKKNGAYVITDGEIEGLLDTFIDEPFEENNERQFMVEAVGQRYGYSVLRIPNERAYKEALHVLRDRAQAWRMLRQSEDISPWDLHMAIPGFAKEEDPRILFDIYLHLFGFEQGKAKLVAWAEGAEERIFEKLEDDTLKPTAAERRFEDFVARLALYLHPGEISERGSSGDDAPMQYAQKNFQHWLRSAGTHEGPVALDLRDVLEQLMAYRERRELMLGSPWPLLNLSLGLDELTQTPVVDVPQALRPIREHLTELMGALRELHAYLTGSERAYAIYLLSPLELTGILARDNHLFQSRESLQEEFTAMVLPEDRPLVGPIFRLFPKEEQLDVTNHAVRVAMLAYIVALEMRLPKAERQMVLRAALPHDLGKRDPDIAFLLQKPTRLNYGQGVQVGLHAVRSREHDRRLPARYRFNTIEGLVIENHNSPEEATLSPEYQRMTSEQQESFQRVLYIVYTSDFLDAFYDYSRDYQKDKRPFQIGNLTWLLPLFRQTIEDGKQARKGEYPLDPQIIGQVEAAFQRIAKRITQGRPTRRDLSFTKVMRKATPIWFLYQMLKHERESFLLWNAQTYKLRTLDRARDMYLRHLWGKQDPSLADRETLFRDVLHWYGSSAEHFPEFPLDLYAQTMMHPVGPVYEEFTNEVRAVRRRVYMALLPFDMDGPLSPNIARLRRDVVREWRTQSGQRLDLQKADVRKEIKRRVHHRLAASLQTPGRLAKKVRAALLGILRDDAIDPEERFAAALLLGHLGDEAALEMLGPTVSGDNALGRSSWQYRLAGIAAMGALYDNLGIRMRRQRGIREDLARAREGILETYSGILQKELKDKEHSPIIRMRVLYHLADISERRSLEIARQAMGDPSERVRALAVRVFGRFIGEHPDAVPNPDALKATVKALGDRRRVVQWRAREVLVKRGDDHVIVALLRAMEDETHPSKTLVADTLDWVAQSRIRRIIKMPVHVEAWEKIREGTRFEKLSALERAAIDRFDRERELGRLSFDLIKRYADGAPQERQQALGEVWRWLGPRASDIVEVGL